MSESPWASIWTRACMLWIRQPSICVWRCFRGPGSGEAKLPSRCIRCWTCAATSRRLFALPMARCMTVNMLDEIMPEAGAFYVMDRGYIDFERLFVLTLSSAFFVVRTKSNVLLQRRYSHAVDKSTG